MAQSRLELLKTYDCFILEPTSGATKPELEELSEALVSVDYPERLALLKTHNVVGTILANLVDKGLVEYMKCVVECIEPRDRFWVYRLTDNRSCTLLHRAAYHRNVDAVKMLLASITPKEQYQLLSFVDVSSMTALDYAANQSDGDVKVVAALLQQLTDEQKRKLIDCSEVFKKVTAVEDVEQLLKDPSIRGLEESDEAPKKPFVGNTFETENSKEMSGWVITALLEQYQENRVLKKVVQLQEEELRAAASEMAIIRRNISDPQNGLLVIINTKILEEKAERQSMAEELQSLKEFKAKVIASELESKLTDVHDDLEFASEENSLERRLEHVGQKLRELSDQFEAARAENGRVSSPASMKENVAAFTGGVMRSASVAADSPDDRNV